jgi:hypothetical protein
MWLLTLHLLPPVLSDIHTPVRLLQHLLFKMAAVNPNIFDFKKN